MIIAFMGNDGSGKTTIAVLMVSKLNAMRLDVEYHQGSKYLILGLLLERFSKKKLSNLREDFARGGAKKGFKFIPWPFLVFIDCVLVYLAFKLLKRNKIIIFDRYFYDLLMGFEYFGRSNRLIRRFFLSLPKPDFGFILDVSPSVAYGRRKSDDPAELYYYKVQRERYLQLAKDLEIQIVNGEKPLDHLTKTLFNKIKVNLVKK